MSTRRPGDTSQAQTGTAVLLLALAAAIGLAVVAAAHLSSYSIWSDRDLLRASRLLVDHPTTGAEMNGTYMARVPGAAYYYLLRLLMIFGTWPATIHAAATALVIAGALATFWAMRTVLSVSAAAIAAGIVLAAPSIGALGATIWNPTFSIPLNCLIAALMIVLARGRPWLLPWMTALLAVAVQVHLSNLTLLPSIVVALFLFGRGLKPRHWLTAIIAFIAVFSPYLIEELLTGWRTTRLILEGHGQPLISSPHPSDLLRVAMAIVGGPDPQAALRPLALPNAVTAAASAFVLVAIAGRVGLAAWRWWHGHGSLERSAGERDRIVLMFAVVLAGVGLILVANRNSSVLLRYATPLIGPLVVLAGVAIGDVIAAAARLGRWPGRLTAVTVALVLVGTALLRFEAARRSGYPTDVERAVATLRQHFGFDDEALKARVLLLDGGATPAVRFVTAGYLNTLVPAPKTAASAYPGCAAVSWSTASEDGIRAGLQAFGSQLPGGPLDIERVVQADGITLIGYRLPSGNCWRSLNNPYDPLPGETVSTGICAAMAGDGAVQHRLEGRADSGEWLIVRRTLPGVARLCLGFRLAREDAAPIVTLYSNHFRGYTGFPTDGYQMRDARLTFFTADGRIVTAAPLLDGGIGGQNNPVMTPWRARLAAPPTGATRLQFDAELISSQGNDTVRLSEQAELAGLAWLN